MKQKMKNWVFLSSKRLKRGWKVLVWENVRVLCNKRLPNGRKSDIEIYQNAQICYERGDMDKDSVRRRETCDKKNLQKQDKLVRWDKKRKIHIKFDVFKFKEITERLESFSENPYIFVATICEEDR